MKNKKNILVGMLIVLTLIIITTMMIFPRKNKSIKNLSEAKVATFAGGCFWCVEADFQKLAGVLESISGYTGGTVENPEYKQVSAGGTGHQEAVQVYYDKDKVSYRELVQYFFKHVDPTDAGGSFGDRGDQYTSAIFYGNLEEKKIAEEEKKRLSESGAFEKEVATAIKPLGKFFEAEEYHQNYSDRNSIRYKYYRNGSGRNQFLEEVWGENKSNEAVKYLKETEKFDLSKLTPLQLKVTQENGTEPAFKNEYWDEKREGIYVDVISGQPLFSSKDKYVSGTGWPSFTKPIAEDAVIEKEDKKLFTTRIEIKSSVADSHLGHVFDDGPEPTGLRYCMNSAAFRFIPKEELVKEGYEEYFKLF